MDKSGERVAKKQEKVVKKKVTRKTTTKKRVKKKAVTKAEKALSPEEITHFDQLLREKRRQLVGDVTSMEDEALKKSRLDASGDLSSMPIHMADIGTDNYEQEFTLGLLDSERKLLREINDAIGRIESNKYGVCEGTDRQIQRNRLDAKPWARYCIEYARMVEKGLLKEGEKIEDDEELDKMVG